MPAPNALMTLTTPDNTGASRVAFEYAKSLTRAGANVFVAHGSVSEDKSSLLREMRSAGIVTHLEPRLASPAQPQLVRDLAGVVENNQLNCVIGNNQRDRALAVHVAKRAKVPSIVCGHNQHVFRGSWPVRFLKRLYYGNAMRRADLLFCSSSQVQSEFVQMFGVDKGRCRLLPHGIDLTQLPCRDANYRGSDIRTQLGVADTDFLISHAGRLDPQKGQDILLRSVGKLPSSVPWRLAMIGAVCEDSKQAENRTYQQELEAFAKSLPDPKRVIFTGWRDDYDKIILASDAYVHPARWEGLPLTVLAAMAMQTPVAIADNSSRPPGFEHGVHGLAFAEQDANATTAAIQEMHNLSRDERHQLSIRARKLVETNFDMSTIGQKFAQIAGELVQTTQERS